MKDILTVTCSDHKIPMLLQAYSLNKFYKTKTTHYVFVEDDKMSVTEWQSLLQPEYTFHNLVIIPAHSERIVDNVEKLGWCRQQWIKFWAANFIQNDYIILDSKNFLIDTVTEEQFPEEGNDRLWWLKDGKNEAHRPFVQYVSRKWKLPYYGAYWAIETPFVFKKSVAERVLDLDCKELFEHALVLPSEFLLYRMACDVEDINDKNSICRVYWTADQLSPVETPMIGIHDYIFYKTHERAIDFLEQFKTRAIIPARIIDQFQNYHAPRMYRENE
jgi:hypothetical protein